jgi:CTP:molybdopterin cytidylyltransferase MocA
LFRRDLFPELLKLTADQDGLALIERYSDKTEFLEWSKEAAFIKVAAFGDYERLNKLA